MDGFQESQPLCQKAKEFQMATRNHSRRVHAPFSEQAERGYAGDYERRGEYGNGSREGRGHDEEESWGWDESGRVGEFVGRNPYTTVLTSFGIGFGLGLFVTLLISRRESSWFERYAPEAMQNLPDRLKHLPDQLKHLPDRLKHVPESVASYVPSSWKNW
jgi:hypothetical protein